MSQIQVKATAEEMAMAIQMAVDDCGFFVGIQDEAKFCINMNDVWAWATADSEVVEWHEMKEVHAIWESSCKTDMQALTAWACKKRNAKPQKRLFMRMKPEIQEQLKDLPRFGDSCYEVGEGKSVTFDDGWGKS